MDDGAVRDLLTPRERFDRARDGSESWKAHVKDPSKSSPWRTDYHQMALKTAWLFSEHYVLVEKRIKDKARVAAYKKLLKSVTAEVDANWDKTRFPDDPQKYGGQFPDQRAQYMLLILRKLKSI